MNENVIHFFFWKKYRMKCKTRYLSIFFSFLGGDIGDSKKLVFCYKFFNKFGGQSSLNLALKESVGHYTDLYHFFSKKNDKCLCEFYCFFYLSKNRYDRKSSSMIWLFFFMMMMIIITVIMAICCCWCRTILAINNNNKKLWSFCRCCCWIIKQRQQQPFFVYYYHFHCYYYFVYFFEFDWSSIGQFLFDLDFGHLFLFVCVCVNTQ